MEQMTFQELGNELMRLYGERRYRDALGMIEKHADRFPEQRSRTTFWRMCLLSLDGRQDDVLSLLQQGLDSGLWWAKDQFLDTDFDSIRALPEFQHLVAAADQKCLEAREHVKPDRTLLLPDDTSAPMPFLIALHGRNGNKDSNLEFWDVARRRGWLVLSPQSRLALFEGSYCWDDSEQGLNDILFYVEEIMQSHTIDRDRIVIGGFSQGSGMAMYTALHGNTGARGFIGIGTWWQNPAQLAIHRPAVRGYFVTGEKDHTLERAREIQTVLKDNKVPFIEEVYADLGHAFPEDFEATFDKAIRFILE